MELLPNETIHSLIARSKLLAIHKRAGSHYQSIIDCSYTQTCGTITYRLEKLSVLLQVSLNELIHEHTSYPYFAHSMTEPHAEMLYEAIKNDSSKALEMLTGSATSRLGIPNHHAFCPICAEDDIKQFGVAYWHQFHELPSVTACHIHKCQLIRTPVQPKILSIPDIRQSQALTASDNEILFASLSASLCSKSSPNLAPLSLIESYKKQLALAGYMTESGLVRSGQLLTDIRQCWATLFQLPDFKNLRTDGKKHNFVRDILRLPLARTHPVKHILLSGFLNQQSATPTIRSSKPGTRIEGKAGDEQQAIALLQQGVSLSKTAKLSGISYYSIRKLVVTHQISHQTKPRKISPEQEQIALNLLKSGLSMKKVGVEVGLSESGVDNLLSAYPDIRAARHKVKRVKFEETRKQHRKQALCMIEQNSGLYRKAIIETDPTVFQWLLNHDKHWLYKQLPPPKTPSQAQSQRYKNQHNLWKEKQQSAIRGLRGLANIMVTCPPENRRLSPAYILKSLGVRNTQGHTRKRMPIFWRQLTRLAETHEEYQLRKLYRLHDNEPALFQVYSARRILKLAASYPPVTEQVFERVKQLQKGEFPVLREAWRFWLILRITKNHNHQKCCFLQYAISTPSTRNIYSMKVIRLPLSNYEIQQFKIAASS